MPFDNDFHQRQHQQEMQRQQQEWFRKQQEDFAAQHRRRWAAQRDAHRRAAGDLEDLPPAKVGPLGVVAIVVVLAFIVGVFAVIVLNIGRSDGPPARTTRPPVERQVPTTGTRGGAGTSEREFIEQGKRDCLANGFTQEQCDRLFD